MTQRGTKAFRAALWLLPTATLFAAGPAAAFVPTYFNLRIPAAACKPATATDAGKLTLTNGSWKFKSGGGYGSASLICPVHVAEGIENDFKMDRMRVWFYDSDAEGSAAEVSATLKRRGQTSGLGAIFGSPLNFSSNIYPTIANQRGWVDYEHLYNIGYTYSVWVVMYRNSNHTTTPEFTGVDFCKDNEDQVWCDDDFPF